MMGRGWIRSQRGLPRGDTKIRAVSLRSLLRCLIVALSIVWLILSLYISGNNLDGLPRLGLTLAKYTGRFHYFDNDHDELNLNETLRRVILSTPKQEKPDITISDAPPHMDGYEFEHCELSCNIRSGGADDRSDGSFSSSDPARGITFTMESITNYPQHGYENAKSTHRIVMNTQLISDIPLHYNNWEYQYLRPIVHENKPELAMASAFISNCGAQSFRLQAIEALIANNVTIEQYGNCGRTKEARDGNDKIATIARHIFTLAFENSEEEDYVTEKFFQALEAGTVPVSLGAPNIDDYAPQPETYLHLRTLEDVPRVASRMREIANTPSLYRHYLRYKTEGLSDKFLALTDMTIPHTFCQACYIFADDKNDLRGRARGGGGRQPPRLLPRDDTVASVDDHRASVLRARADAIRIPGPVRIVQVRKLRRRDVRWLPRQPDRGGVRLLPTDMDVLQGREGTQSEGRGGQCNRTVRVAGTSNMRQVHERQDVFVLERQPSRAAG